MKKNQSFEQPQMMILNCIYQVNVLSEETLCIKFDEDYQPFFFSSYASVE